MEALKDAIARVHDRINKCEEELEVEHIYYRRRILRRMINRLYKLSLNLSRQRNALLQQQIASFFTETDYNGVAREEVLQRVYELARNGESIDFVTEL
jgi:hypothetical protein